MSAIPTCVDGSTIVYLSAWLLMNMHIFHLKNGPVETGTNWTGGYDLTPVMHMYIHVYIRKYIQVDEVNTNWLGVLDLLILLFLPPTQGSTVLLSTCLLR